MFKGIRFKKVLIISIVLVLALGTIATAANQVYQKKLTATYGRIKFKVGGKDVTKEIEKKYNTPAFIVDGRSYVPVRAIAELLDMEIKWDEETYTAEIIDVKSKAYEEELKKRDNEIAELKKEIEKLKEKAEEEKAKKEKDIKDIEKELNSKFGTYEGVDFDIVLKESSNRIDVNITMDLRDVRQENYWNRIKHSDRKALIEDIVDIILSEISNVDIYGSIYDEYYRKDVLTFNKKKNSSLSISYGSSSSSRGYYDRDIEDIVYNEFDKEKIKVYIDDIDTRNYEVYLSIDLDISRSEYVDIKNYELLDTLDRIADKIFYYYDYDHDDDRVIIDIYVDGKYETEYRIYGDEKYGKYYK
ncbi:stalk domain-containing protein [Tepidimicrobium xylanilyticum]